LEAEIELVRESLKDDIQKLRKKPREISMRLSSEQFRAEDCVARRSRRLVRETRALTS